MSRMSDARDPHGRIEVIDPADGPSDDTPDHRADDRWLYARPSIATLDTERARRAWCEEVVEAIFGPAEEGS
jgi:hypothetical protein